MKYVNDITISILYLPVIFDEKYNN